MATCPFLRLDEATNTSPEAPPPILPSSSYISLLEGSEQRSFNDKLDSVLGRTGPSSEESSAPAGLGVSPSRIFSLL